ncbi:MAG: hypothetical protein HY744_32140 [Deltaproteobacteria bacterium]|nr:hypothetical protein [Deltaproteobacteria bacterium]
MSHRRPGLGARLVVGVLLVGCGASEGGADEGGALEGRWAGPIVCEGDYAYQMAFYLDGEGAVSDVDIHSNFTASLCPGGPATFRCGGAGDYTYVEQGSRFHMDVEYESCKCGGVSVQMLTRDSFDGTFDGSSTLSGAVGCDFTFRR